MTDSQKKIVAVLSSLFLVCACCGGPILWSSAAFTSSIITGTTEMKQITNEIATYTLPTGYSESFAFNFTGNKVITIVDDMQVPSIFIFMAKVPPTPGVDQSQLESQMNLIVAQFNVQPVVFTQERTETRIINQQKTNIIYSSGQDSNGTRQQQVRLFFKSSKGLVFMMAYGPEDKWDQASIEQLLDSLK